MPRYIFDVTALRPYLARHSQLSGIQRVSIKTMIRTQERLGSDNVWFGYHDRITNTYRVHPWPTDSQCDLTHYTTLCEVLHIRPSLHSLPRMDKYAKRPLKRHWKVWVRDFQAKRGNKKYFQRVGLALEDWTSARAELSGAAHRPHPHQRLESIARVGDRLVLLDNAWHPRGLEPWLKHARTDLGLDVYVLLHDLIPVVTPYYTEGDMSFRLYDWLVRAPEYVTCFLANSESTARDLRAFLESQGANLPVTVVPLAQAPLHDAAPSLGCAPGNASDSTYSGVREAVRLPDHIRALIKTPYVLVVGTMEVRKNLWQLATVWDRLRQQSFPNLPKLVFAGRHGWMNEDFDRLMQATGQLGGWAEIVEGPGDDTLAFLYRNCLFTVTASFYEGWGLPIGESLAYGKTAVVSNTSSMPEVGGDMVEYCDPHSLDSIEAACLRLIDNPDHRVELEERISKTHLRSWDEVAQDMLQALEHPA